MRTLLSDIKIRYRLPLLIGLVLVSLILVSTWASYISVKNTSLEAGYERLVYLTEQISSLLQQSTIAVANKTAEVGNAPAVRDYLASQTPEHRAAVAHLLEQFQVPVDQGARSVELWNASGSRLLVLPNESAAESHNIDAEIRKSDVAPFKSFGPLIAVNDVPVYSVVVAVRDEAGKVVGYLVRWRKLTTTPESRKQLISLIGEQSTLYLGNTKGDVWSDMGTIVASPPAALNKAANVVEYNRDNAVRLALSRSVAGTPWTVAIELPRESMMLPASRFLRRTLLIGLVLLIIGVATTFWMSRSITNPLQSLTTVASAITAGDYSRTADTNRKDELGDLASAFNGMVSQLREAQLELEQKVRKRTAELEAANKQLELLSQTNLQKRTEAEFEKTQAMDALRLTEEQLQQAQKLEAVGRLAGGVAHDFNNLLTAILGYSELSLKRLPANDPIKQNIEGIKEAGERAASLVRQLLAFSRKQVLQPKTLDLNSVISNLQKMLPRMIGEDIELRTQLQRDLGKVKADPTQIEQVIMNLVVNARDALPTGGNVTIETANVYLDEAYVRDHVAVTPGNYVMLAVSDNGNGMDVETQRQMFEPFFTTKEMGKGTGLGLSMVYGIVKQSGGNIWVYSEPGLGTTFKIYLPTVEGEVEKEATTKYYSSPVNETLMLVEDDDGVRELLLSVLQEEGYHVLTAASGAEALKVCESYDGPIHLLITDVIMPGMSGKQLVKQLVGTCRETRVLYMSGYTDDAIVNHGVLEPGAAFLQKPFTPVGVLNKVREVLSTVSSSAKVQ